MLVRLMWCGIRPKSAWVMDAGTYTFLFGASSRDIRANATADMASAKSWPAHNVLAPQK